MTIVSIHLQSSFMTMITFFPSADGGQAPWNSSHSLSPRSFVFPTTHRGNVGRRMSSKNSNGYFLSRRKGLLELCNSPNLNELVGSGRRSALREASAPGDTEVQISGTSGRTESSEMRTAQLALERALMEKADMGKGTTDLVSNNMHRAWVAAGFGGIVGMLAKAGSSVQNGADAATVIAAVFAAYVLADLGTGIYHWGVDNYGNANTPVFGEQIDAFQGHHQRPWTITKREFANNLHALARPTFFVLVPFLLAPSNPGLDSFVGVFMAGVMLSQQFHAWSHTPKTLLPAPVVALQDAGLLVGRKMHGAHHRPPYNINYCIVSGLCNKPLDASGFIPWMEGEILKRWGVAPRSWGETAPEWLEEVGYYENGQNVDTL